MVSSHTEEGRPAMTRTQTTPTAAALVAIDVAKLRNDVLIEVPDTRRRRRLTVVGADALGHAARDEQVREHVDHVRGVQLARHPDPQALVGELVHDV
jgi:hypothetical protein